MPHCITVLAGPARSGKTERLLARYRSALAARPLGATLWLAPTWRAASEVRQRLLDGTLPGCFRPGIMTFANYADSVLLAAGVPIRPLSRLMKRALVRRTIRDQFAHGRLRHFAPIAETSGLVDLVCEFIGELKRLEIWPEEFQRACATRGATAKDAELFELYAAYQQALQEHGLYDAEGRFWSARDELQNMPLDKRRMDLVVLDGFTDFTRTQHEIIDILAEGTAELFVSLPLEAEPRRGDLFAKPLATLDKLRRRHPHLVVEELPRAAAATWPALAHIERTLFVNPRLAACTDAALPEVRDIEILAAARQEGEARLIGGAIKRLLVDGAARPGDIAVVFHSPQEAGPLLAEVFARLGIPVVFDLDYPLERAPALRALTRLLQLDLDNWPFDELLAVIRSSYFRPTWFAWEEGRGAAAVEQCIRQLQIPHGRQRLLDELHKAGDERQAGHHDADELRAPSHEAYRAAQVLLHGLAQLFEELPQQASLSDWAEAWQRLAEKTGLLHALSDQSLLTEIAGAPLGEWAAWERLRKTLGDSGVLAQWLKQAPPQLDRRQAWETLRDILRSERIGHAGDEAGHVRVLSAASVRSLQIPYLFLAGLSELAFPPPDREDRLYSEADYLRLIEAGLPLVARTERSCEEMLLFYEALTRATRRLYLSYPALDESAQPLAPSPYLQEVEQVFADRLPRTEWSDLSPVPRDEEPLSAEDFRVKALATAMAGAPALLAGLLQTAPPANASAPIASSMVDNLLAGVAFNYLRQDRAEFSVAEGILPSATAHAYLTTRYALSHTFSATALEQYAACPFRFFAERLLQIEPLVDLTLEFDVLERGRMLHDVLALFHRRVNERQGRPASPLELEPAVYDDLLAGALDEAAAAAPAHPVAAALAEVNRRQVRQWLSRYRAQCEKYDRQWCDCEEPLRPALFEVSFGRSDEPPSTSQPLEIYAEQVVRLSGRIDRIDIGQIAGRTVFSILDYKSGGAARLTPENIVRGVTLQLPLYALAALDLFLADRDAIPWQAAYWYVRDDGVKPRQALAMYRNDGGRIELEPLWEQVRDVLADTVWELVAGIRHGRFPVCSVDEHCTGYCPLRTACRINQVRSLEKPWPPPAKIQ